MRITFSKRDMSHLVRISVMGLTLGLFTSCAQLQEVKVATAPSLRSASVQVDVVGVTASNHNAVEGVPVSKYFQSGNAVRQGVRSKSMRFGDNQPSTQVITKDDPIWQSWLNDKAVSIVVLADIPGVFDDLPGDADPRRKILPLSGKEAPKGAVQIEVTQGGLQVTPQK